MFTQGHHIKSSQLEVYCPSVALLIYEPKTIVTSILWFLGWNNACLCVSMCELIQSSAYPVTSVHVGESGQHLLRSYKPDTTVVLFTVTEEAVGHCNRTHLIVSYISHRPHYMLSLGLLTWTQLILIRQQFPPSMSKSQPAWRRKIKWNQIKWHVVFAQAKPWSWRDALVTICNKSWSEPMNQKKTLNWKTEQFLSVYIYMEWGMVRV